MLKIVVVSVLLALIHSSVCVLVELDSTDFGASPCGWTLQNFEQLGSVEAAEQYRIQSTGDENRYLVLTETKGQINNEYELKQSAEIELRFKYYQTGGTLNLLYLEADNSVPVHVAYSHDGEENSKGWRYGEAHISRSATEQPFTILFEATTKDPKEDPVALDSLTILFEDVGAYKRSLTYESPREESLQEQQDTVKKLEAIRNIENHNTNIDSKELQEHTYVESKDNHQKLEEKFHKIPFDRLKKESLKISENRKPRKRDFRFNKKAEHYLESNKNHLSENTRGGLISRKKIIPETIWGLNDHQKYESKEEGSLSGSFDSSLELIKSKPIEKENINKDKQRRQADGTESSDDPTNEPEETSENGDNQENAPGASEGNPESDGNEQKAPETNEEDLDAKEDPKGTSATDEEPPTDAPGTNEKTPAPENNPTNAPETNQETSPPENNPTNAPDTNQVTSPPESKPTNAPDTNQETSPPESKPTNAPDTNQETSPPESKPTNAPDTNQETPPPETNASNSETEKNPTKAPNIQDNPTNTTKAPEDNTEPPISNQESQEDNNSKQTETPPDVTESPNVKNTTSKRGPETTNKPLTVAPVPPTDKETTQAPANNSTKPTDPIPPATGAPSPPPLTTAVITSKPDATTNKAENTDDQEGSIKEPGNTHLWYIPVVLVAFVVCGVVLFRYLQLKKRRGGYARTGSSSVRGGDYTNPTFSRDAGDDGRIYDGGGRSYDSTR